MVPLFAVIIHYGNFCYPSIYTAGLLVFDNVIIQ